MKKNKIIDVKLKMILKDNDVVVGHYVTNDIKRICKLIKLYRLQKLKKGNKNGRTIN